MLRKLDNVAIVIFGLLMILGSLVCLLVSFNQSAAFRRWQATPLIQETGQLPAAGQGTDVTLVGSIAPETPAPAEGLALYERWERKTRYRGGQQQTTWERIFAYDHKPPFELLLGERGITIRAGHAILHGTQEVALDQGVKLTGLAPGVRVTVLGEVTSADEPLEVEAEVICGGERRECLEQFSKFSTVAAIVAALLILAGGGLAWLGIRRLLKEGRQ